MTLPSPSAPAGRAPPPPGDIGPLSSSSSSLSADSPSAASPGSPHGSHHRLTLAERRRLAGTQPAAPVASLRDASTPLAPGPGPATGASGPASPVASPAAPALGSPAANLQLDMTFLSNGGSTAPSANGASCGAPASTHSSGPAAEQSHGSDGLPHPPAGSRRSSADPPSTLSKQAHYSSTNSIGDPGETGFVSNIRVRQVASPLASPLSSPYPSASPSLARSTSWHRGDFSSSAGSFTLSGAGMQFGISPSPSSNSLAMSPGGGSTPSRTMSYRSSARPIPMPSLSRSTSQSLSNCSSPVSGTPPSAIGRPPIPTAGSGLLNPRVSLPPTPVHLGPGAASPKRPERQPSTGGGLSPRAVPAPRSGLSSPSPRGAAAPLASPRAGAHVPAGAPDEDAPEPEQEGPGSDSDSSLESDSASASSSSFSSDEDLSDEEDAFDEDEVVIPLRRPLATATDSRDSVSLTEELPPERLTGRESDGSRDSLPPHPRSRPLSQGPLIPGVSSHLFHSIDSMAAPRPASMHMDSLSSSCSQLDGGRGAPRTSSAGPGAASGPGGLHPSPQAGFQPHLSQSQAAGWASASVSSQLSLYSQLSDVSVATTSLMSRAPSASSLGPLSYYPTTPMSSFALGPSPVPGGTLQPYRLQMSLSSTSLATGAPATPPAAPGPGGHLASMSADIPGSHHHHHHYHHHGQGATGPTRHGGTPTSATSSPGGSVGSPSDGRIHRKPSVVSRLKNVFKHSPTPGKPGTGPNTPTGVGPYTGSPRIQAMPPGPSGPSPLSHVDHHHSQSNLPTNFVYDELSPHPSVYMSAVAPADGPIHSSLSSGALHTGPAGAGGATSGRKGARPGGAHLSTAPGFHRAASSPVLPANLRSTGGASGPEHGSSPSLADMPASLSASSGSSMGSGGMMAAGSSERSASGQTLPRQPSFGFDPSFGFPQHDGPHCPDDYLHLYGVYSFGFQNCGRGFPAAPPPAPVPGLCRGKLMVEFFVSANPTTVGDLHSFAPVLAHPRSANIHHRGSVSSMTGTRDRSSSTSSTHQGHYHQHHQRRDSSSSVASAHHPHHQQHHHHHQPQHNAHRRSSSYASIRASHNPHAAGPSGSRRPSILAAGSPFPEVAAAAGRPADPLATDPAVPSLGSLARVPFFQVYSSLATESQQRGVAALSQIFAGDATLAAMATGTDLLASAEYPSDRTPDSPAPMGRPRSASARVPGPGSRSGSGSESGSGLIAPTPAPDALDSFPPALIQLGLTGPRLPTEQNQSLPAGMLVTYRAALAAIWWSPPLLDSQVIRDGALLYEHEAASRLFSSDALLMTDDDEAVFDASSRRGSVVSVHQAVADEGPGSPSLNRTRRHSTHFAPTPVQFDLSALHGGPDDPPAGHHAHQSHHSPPMPAVTSITSASSSPSIHAHDPHGSSPGDSPGLHGHTAGTSAGSTPSSPPSSKGFFGFFSSSSSASSSSSSSASHAADGAGRKQSTAGAAGRASSISGPTPDPNAGSSSRSSSRRSSLVDLFSPASSTAVTGTAPTPVPQVPGSPSSAGHDATGSGNGLFAFSLRRGSRSSDALAIPSGAGTIPGPGASGSGSGASAATSPQVGSAPGPASMIGSPRTGSFGPGSSPHVGDLSSPSLQSIPGSPGTPRKSSFTSGTATGSVPGPSRAGGAFNRSASSGPMAAAPPTRVGTPAGTQAPVVIAARTLLYQQATIGTGMAYLLKVDPQPLLAQYLDRAHQPGWSNAQSVVQAADALPGYSARLTHLIRDAYMQARRTALQQNSPTNLSADAAGSPGSHSPMPLPLRMRILVSRDREVADRVEACEQRRLFASCKKAMLLARMQMRRDMAAAAAAIPVETDLTPDVAVEAGPATGAPATGSSPAARVELDTNIIARPNMVSGQRPMSTSVLLFPSADTTVGDDNTAPASPDDESDSGGSSTRPSPTSEEPYRFTSVAEHGPNASTDEDEDDAVGASSDGPAGTRSSTDADAQSFGVHNTGRSPALFPSPASSTTTSLLGSSTSSIATSRRMSLAPEIMRTLSKSEPGPAGDAAGLAAGAGGPSGHAVAGGAAPAAPFSAVIEHIRRGSMAPTASIASAIPGAGPGLSALGPVERVSIPRNLKDLGADSLVSSPETVSVVNPRLTAFLNSADGRRAPSAPDSLAAYRRASVATHVLHGPSSFGAPGARPMAMRPGGLGFGGPTGGPGSSFAPASTMGTSGPGGSGGAVNPTDVMLAVRRSSLAPPLSAFLPTNPYGLSGLAPTSSSSFHSSTGPRASIQQAGGPGSGGQPNPDQLADAVLKGHIDPKTMDAVSAAAAVTALMAARKAARDSGDSDHSGASDASDYSYSYSQDEDEDEDDEEYGASDTDAGPRQPDYRHPGQRGHGLHPAYHAGEDDDDEENHTHLVHPGMDDDDDDDGEVFTSVTNPLFLSMAKSRALAMPTTITESS
ncbi:hypothetical protein H696_05099 [Fonticula alba]|uniref:Uncharacterized protein n=1 Tax=Fonticula alba TaxID=691883 RepID=A0A058Z207_FONAL|nr:hypothetical protein H696_05099 [Fonticula alba]KCV68171.1 hypothetical protein H696_05099 [Fonticula alba]|eukprot:XP_009497225.1 hypothetical protein H696_05099 [Fonticula alba]